MKEPSRSKNKKSESSRYRWALSAFLMAVGMSALLSFASEAILSQAGLLLALLIWLLFSTRKRKSTRGERNETH